MCLVELYVTKGLSHVDLVVCHIPMELLQGLHIDIV